MYLKIDNEFKNICKQILDYDKKLSERVLIESDDMFQTDNYCGGFDTIENEF